MASANFNKESVSPNDKDTEKCVKEMVIDSTEISNSKECVQDVKEIEEERVTKNGKKVHEIIKNVKMTLQHLDECLKGTHKTEINLFQEELKLVADNQQLLFQLDREKFKNAQLKSNILIT